MDHHAMETKGSRDLVDSYTNVSTQCNFEMGAAKSGAVPDEEHPGTDSGADR